MNSLLSKHFEEGIQNIQDRISRKKKGEYEDNLAGVYFLSTSLQELDEHTFGSI